ncbi:dihydrodipicolinate synthase family protein [Pseudooceanicola algae]|uniref:4-hydroxy-tetrahydrodipicolinate synthase n=1 Tax=Pseudooceanicola algae TaxID=1537215 RepID=A0A418SHQ8_9RHOB|nr:dihydrodipicolinate synthase family protein [Pseudooceanicola algae]QPM90267.1 4-hydroxy-tetrahydrodipicolinate synthase [Pseudooceanicola algae]
MNYTRATAKSHSRATMRGIWAAANTPFAADGSIDEAGFRANMEHWIEDLKIDGFFVAGKQGEFFSMSLEERKRIMSLAVEICGDRAQTIMSCSDQNLDVVLDLARHAQDCGADYIVVHAPVLNFLKDREQTLIRYYETIANAVDIGIALWSHPDSGYLMSPQLCARLAEIETVVAIKYSVPREMYAELTRLAGDRIIVSTASEDEWLDNVLELGWQLYLCSSPPYLLQTAGDLRMKEYTELAFAGKAEEARAVSASLDPVRAAIKASKPDEKPFAHQKYWQELLGQVGGPVRAPMLELTEDEKTAIRAAFDGCGLTPS